MLTVSLRNTELLESLGVTYVVDRSITFPSALAAEFAGITPKPIPLVVDATSAVDTQQLGYDTLAEGGHVLVVVGSSIKETPGTNKRVLVVFGSVHALVKQGIGRVLAENLPSLVEAGHIVWKSCRAGLGRLQDNLASGNKLIVRPGETGSLPSALR